MSVVGSAEGGYQYVVLRCVPRVDRGEYVNVGVVLHCQSADYLGYRGAVDPVRARALWPKVDLEAVETALRTVAWICAGDTRGGPPARAPASERFGFIAAPRSTVVQPGPVHGGRLPRVADGATLPPADLLRALVDRFVDLPPRAGAE